VVEGVGGKRLAQQQRPPAGDGEVDRRERAGPPARADERRAAAVDDVNRTVCYSAAVGRGDVGDDASPLEQRLCLKQGPMRAAIAVVIAGLDPAIHPVRKKVLTKTLDPRVTPPP